MLKLSHPTMDAFSPKRKCNQNNKGRSNSLPTRPNPLVLQCEEHLSRLPESSNSTHFSPSSIAQKLGDLIQLHECVDKLLLLPTTQELLVKNGKEKWLDEILDGWLMLLDMCSIAKDSVIHTKECLRELQSIRRRRRGAEISLEIEVKKFLTSRKIVKRSIQKALGNSKRGNKSIVLSSNNDCESVAVETVLREVEAATMGVIESLLCVVSAQERPKGSGWDLVSKLMNRKKSNSEKKEEENPNEFADVDAVLLSFQQTNKVNSFVKMENARNCMEKLEVSTQDLEHGLEGLFRRLIRTRVSLLNILNN